MRVSDAALYLVGGKEAILRIAASHWSLVVGLLLVLSASLARNYDGAYLPVEWDVLLHGVTVSVVNSFILYATMHIVIRRRKGVVPSFFSGYLSFLGLFWMTSPMAWVYAVPYERWLEPVDAILANLNTLAFISIWRVALMTRVLSVIFKARWWPVFFAVMLFSDIAVIIGAAMAPVPLIDLMGGLQHSPQDQLLSSANFATRIYGMLSLPVWLIGTVVGMAFLRGTSQVVAPRWERVPWGILATATVCLVAWIGPLIYTQQEQKNRWVAENLLRSQRVPEALALMSSKPRETFPPIWDPPPRIGYGEQTPELDVVAAAIMAEPTAPSVASIFVAKSRREFNRRGEMSWENAAEHIIDDQTSAPIGVPTLAHLQMHLNYDTSLPPDDRSQMERIVKHLQSKARESKIEGSK